MGRLDRRSALRRKVGGQPALDVIGKPIERQEAVVAAPLDARQHMGGHRQVALGDQLRVVGEQPAAVKDPVEPVRLVDLLDQQAVAGQVDLDVLHGVDGPSHQPPDPCLAEDPTRGAFISKVVRKLVLKNYLKK